MAADSKKTKTVRVDVTKLDDLMKLIGELVISRTRLTKISKDVETDAIDKETLKAEILKVERYRESTQLKAKVKTIIYDTLLWLPQEPYSENEVEEKTNVIYQHIYTNYYGGGKSVYNVKVA